MHTYFTRLSAFPSGWEIHWGNTTSHFNVTLIDGKACGKVSGTINVTLIDVTIGTSSCVGRFCIPTTKLLERPSLHTNHPHRNLFSFMVHHFLCSQIVGDEERREGSYGGTQQ